MIEWVWAGLVTGLIVLYFVDVSKKVGCKVVPSPEEEKEETAKKVRELLDRLKEKREGKDG